MRVSVLTPTVSGRERLLEECEASVAAQEAPFEFEHVVELDADRDGPSVLRNRLARRSTGDWLLPLDDDDVLYPDCLRVLLSRSDGADIVYPWCDLDAGITACVNKLWDRVGLHRMNFIPVTFLVRRETWEMLGGMRRVPMEDWDFLRRAELHGCRFRCVPEVLWRYRAGVNTFQAAAA